MRRRFILTLVVIACPVYGQAAAQEPIPEQVPRELVEMLAQSPMGGSVRVLVGKLPPEVSTLLSMPPASRVVGAILYDMLSTSGVMIAEPGSAEAVLNQWHTTLLSEGWKPSADAEEEVETGFLSTPRNSSRRSTERRAPLCAPDGRTVLQMHSAPSPGDSTPILITNLTGAYAASQCREGPRVPRERPTIELPTLRAPVGSSMQGSGWSGGGDPEARGTLRSTMTVDAILAHYATQLTTQGWTPQVPALGADAGVQIFSKANVPGVQWKGVLTVAEIQSNQKALHLRIHSVRRR